MSDSPTEPTPAAAPAPAAPAAEGSYLPLLLVLALALLVVGLGWWLRAPQLAPGSPEALARAKELLAKGEELGRNPEVGPAGALEPLAEAQRLAPEDGRTNLACGSCLVALGRFAEAMPMITRARELLPDEPDGHLAAGIVLNAVNRPEEAKAALERALALRPNDAQALYFLAVAAFSLKDAEGVLRHLDALAVSNRETQPVLQMRIAAYEALGRKADAIAPLSSLCALEPRDIRLRRHLQNMRLDINGWDSAVADARREADAPGADPAAIYLCARLLAQSPRTAPEARPLYDKALAAAPTFPWALAGLAVDLQRQGDIDGARQRLLEALKADPAFSEGQVVLAKLELEAGKFDEARAHYDRLLTTNTFAAEAREGVLSCLLEAGRFDDALAFARTQVPGDAGPGHASRALTARAHLRAGKVAEGRADLAAVRAEVPESTRWWWIWNEGVLVLEAGDLAAARALFEEALAKAPQDVRVAPLLLLWAGVGRALAEPVDLEGARALWQRGAETGQERNPEALHTYACRRLLGQATLDEVLEAARIGGVIDQNDAWFVEGLARQLEGKAELARAAFAKSVELSRPGELPARLAEAR